MKHTSEPNFQNPYLTGQIIYDLYNDPMYPRVAAMLTSRVPTLNTTYVRSHLEKQPYRWVYIPLIDRIAQVGSSKLAVFHFTSLPYNLPILFWLLYLMKLHDEDCEFVHVGAAAHILSTGFPC